MSNTAGTVQTIVLQIAGLLDPLQRELAPERARATLAELGIIVTAAQTNSLAGSLQNAVGNTKDLLQLAAALTTAIDTENVAEIVTKTVEIIEKIAKAIDAIDSIKTAVVGLGSVPPATVDKLPERLFNLLMVKALDSAIGINEFLELLNILQREQHNPGSVDPNNPPFTISTFDFAMVGQWLKSPTDPLRSIYGWGDPSFTGVTLLERLESLLLRLSVPAFFDDLAVPPKLGIGIIDIKAKTDVNPKGLSVALRQNINPGPIAVTVQDLKFEINLDFRLPFDTELIIQPDGKFTFIPPALSDVLEGGLEAKLTADRMAAAEGYTIIGDPGGSRLEVRKFLAVIGGHFKSSSGKSEGDLNIGGAVGGGKLLISMENADGFIVEILGGVRLESNFDFGFALSSKEGLVFVGSSTLEIQLPLHVDLGPIEINTLTFSVGIENNKFPTAISTDIKAALGPLVGVVENIGLSVDFAFEEDRGGNAGPIDITMGFKPPNGVGLSLDTGIVVGGGYLYFDFDREEYAGIMELAIAEIVTVKAIGLITTKMPDGSKGFSLLIIITAEFGTGIQLGFGFTLIGLGGLLGLNRTMNLPPLMEGVRTGAINSIMFPDNPVANAPRIISDLRLIFPPYVGKFLIGPMAKLGWGTPTLISVSLGVIIEIPGNIAILGVLKVALPAEEAPLIVIQVNFAGAIEFDKQRLYFFATLFESRVLFLTIEGDMGLLVAWGDDANFVVSVGGFHPRFNPPPLPFPSPRRIAIDILNTPVYRIRSEGYFAVTSNTVQFGSNTELMIDVGVAQVQGHMTFDALFQFSPFYFIIEISAGVSLKVFGMGLFSISLQFTLEGPTPWRAHGSGSISFLFFDVSADFDVTWGDSQDTTLPPIPVMPLLKAELEKQQNWIAELPVGNNLLVSLRKLSETESSQVLHPLGTLRVSQRAAPLDIRIDKVGSQKPSDANQFKLVPSGDLVKVSDTDEQFAKAQFINMSDADKLSQQAFDPLHSGLKLASGAQTLGSAKLAKRKVRYEQIIIDNNFKRFRLRFKFFSFGFFTHFLQGSAISKSALSKNHRSQLDPFSEKLQVKDGGFTVALAENNRAYSTQAMYFSSETLAQQFIQEQLSLRPELHETLHVIPQHEVTAEA
ncbi:MAG: hypothetical protein PHO08_00740 [Methylococcales bacterium]|nr:hypothetical protein [Methylococcales bacterium]MDD5630459.1 hypothetical protein [Methylococcales bacterium]